MPVLTVRARLKKRVLRDALIVFVAAVCVALYLHWPAFVESDRFHDNWRQCPHWIAPESQQYHPDDLLVRYAEFNTSPGGDWIYRTLALTGGDLIWGKINAVLFFAVTVLCVFITGRAMHSRSGGILAAVLFVFFPCIFKEYSGGFMSALSAPLLCLTVLSLVRGTWWWAVILMAAGSLIYPMVAIHSGMIYLIDVLIRDRKRLFDGHLWKMKYIPLIIAALLSVSILSGKYIASGHEFGDLVSRNHIADRVEFTDAGRYPLIPVPSLWDQLAEHWGNWFHLALFLTAYFFLAKGVFRLPRGLYALLISSLCLYVLADIFLMRLYIPDRYLHFAVPMFMALAGGYWLALVGEREGGRKIVMSIIAVVLIGVGIWEFHGEFEQGQKTWRYQRHDLYAYVRSLPGRPMIAVHPKRGSEIPLMTGKSVLISKELSHPWWTEYWEIMTERTRDFFRAYYATDGDDIGAFVEKYGISYWIIQQRHFTARYISRKRRLYMEPFDRWIKKNLHPSKEAILNHVPRKYRLFDNGRYIVISSEGLMRWLDDRREVENTEVIMQ